MLPFPTPSFSGRYIGHIGWLLGLIICLHRKSEEENNFHGFWKTKQVCHKKDCNHSPGFHQLSSHRRHFQCYWVGSRWLQSTINVPDICFCFFHNLQLCALRYICVARVFSPSFKSIVTFLSVFKCKNYHLSFSTSVYLVK